MAVTTDDWLQAQYAVLGAALIDSDRVPKVVSETSERDYSGACRTVYATMRRLFLSGAVVDPVSVSNALGAEHRNFILQLMDITPSAISITT